MGQGTPSAVDPDAQRLLFAQHGRVALRTQAGRRERWITVSQREARSLQPGIPESNLELVGKGLLPRWQMTVFLVTRTSAYARTAAKYDLKHKKTTTKERYCFVYEAFL